MTRLVGERNWKASSETAVAADVTGILDAIIKNVEGSLEAQLAVLLPEGDRLAAKGASEGLNLQAKELAVADWAFRNRQPAGRGTETLVSAELLYLPLQTTTDVLGVLGIKLADEAGYTSPETRRLLNAFVTQATLAIERVQLVKQAEQAQILQARESLERALLNSVSHDLRTPLVSITGALGTLRDEGYELTPAARRELLDAAWDEAGRLNRFVGNLLDMTRLEAGAVKPKEELSDVQDLIRLLDLPVELGEALDPSVREEYRRLWQTLRGE
jgi:two-component system sensor histidine kinase KdpD